MDIKKAENVLEELRQVQEQHKNDRVSTFELRVSDMARDAADVIEYLLKLQEEKVE